MQTYSHAGVKTLSDNKPPVSNNVKYLRYLVMLSEAVFSASVLVAYYDYKDASLDEFLYIMSIFSTAMVLLEVPSGYLSDHFSRKGVLLTGTITLCIGQGVFVVCNGFWQLLIPIGIIAFGRSLISGTASAMLYDTLLSEKKKEHYSREEGKMKSYAAYSLASAGLLGGFLFSIHPELPQIISCVILIPAIGYAFRLIEPPIHKPHATTIPVKQMLTFVHYATRGHEELPWIIAFAGVVCSGTLLGFWLAQPYWEFVGIPIWLFGVLFFITQIVRGFVLSASTSVIDKVSNKLLSLGLIVMLCSGFVLQAFITQPIGIILTLLPGIVYGITHIMVLRLINERVESHMRATVISMESMAWRAMFMITAPFIGFITDNYDLETTFLICAALWAVMATLPIYKLDQKKIL